MSEEASQYMARLAEMCASHGHRRWMKFDGGEHRPVHAELLSLGLIKRQGTRAASYVFTDAGMAWVLNHS